MNPGRTWLTPGAELIAAERRRQIDVDGYTSARDLRRTPADFLAAGAVWPWPSATFKPGTIQRDLEKAGALIAAGLDLLPGYDDDGDTR